jgi:hypothetical protein
MPRNAPLKTDGAREIAATLRDAHCKYFKEEKGRDWSDRSLSDCSKFVQLALEKAGQGDLFTRAHATTADMRRIISGIGGAKPYRKMIRSLAISQSGRSTSPS